MTRRDNDGTTGAAGPDADGAAAPELDLTPKQLKAREATVARWRHCQSVRREALEKGNTENSAFEAARTVWNNWAYKRLRGREGMENNNVWRNEEKRSAWEEESLTVFSGCVFAEDGEGSSGSKPADGKSILLDDGPADFSGFVFPGDAHFHSATFTGDAYFRSGTFTGDAHFLSATFTGDAYFRSATFTGDAHFPSATFTGVVSFWSATFTGDANFWSATFTGDAHFPSATFTGDAHFPSATFTGDADFQSTTFTGDAYFGSATFAGDANFESATFTSDTNFHSTTFTGDATFNGINCGRTFSLSHSTSAFPPDLRNSVFVAPPDLEDVRIAYPAKRFITLQGWPGWLNPLRWIGIAADGTYSGKYRFLKKLAIDGEDHERELVFFAGELKAKRVWHHRPWELWRSRGWTDLWPFVSSYIYEWLSNFGRSFLRPLGWMAANFVGFAEIYHRHGRTAAAGDGLLPSVEAMLVSAGNLFPFLGLGLSEKREEAIEVLYGEAVDIPHWVTTLSVVQTLISAALVFLFLLAVRNHFRIK